MAKSRLLRSSADGRYILLIAASRANQARILIDNDQAVVPEDAIDAYQVPVLVDAFVLARHFFLSLYRIGRGAYGYCKSNNDH